MKKIITWIGVGILLSVVAFFIPEQSGNMWPSLIASAIVAGLYLIIFMAVWLRKINSAKKRKAIAITLTVFLVFSLASAVISYEGSVRQQETLSDIRVHLETNIVYHYIHEPLVKTLGKFYDDEISEKNMGELFVTEYDSLINEDGVFAYGSQEPDEQTLFLYISKTSVDSVILVGESSYLKGTESDFDNWSGNKGRFQVRGILTKKGVDYERQN